MHGISINEDRLYYLITVPAHLREMATAALEVGQLPALAAKLRYADGLAFSSNGFIRDGVPRTDAEAHADGG